LNWSVVQPTASVNKRTALMMSVMKAPYVLIKVVAPGPFVVLRKAGHFATCRGYAPLAGWA